VYYSPISRTRSRGGVMPKTWKQIKAEMKQAVEDGKAVTIVVVK
jgi:hypothetical protein